uniref:Polyketide synthase n=1 Tax=Peronospora matthiolae TaxID=2874970 RepID=A0AAV1TRL6_9STRA
MGWFRPRWQRLIRLDSLPSFSTRRGHRTRLRSSLRVTKSLAFQVPRPLEEFAVRVSNLARSPLSPCSTPSSSLSFQLGIDSLFHRRIHIFLGNQDANAIVARAHRRLCMQ